MVFLDRDEVLALSDKLVGCHRLMILFAVDTGMRPMAIQARVGHSSISVNLDRYGRLFPGLDTEIADAIHREFLAANNRRSPVGCGEDPDGELEED
jgi:hypothetical protein